MGQRFDIRNIQKKNSQEVDSSRIEDLRIFIFFLYTSHVRNRVWSQE